MTLNLSIIGRSDSSEVVARRVVCAQWSPDGRAGSCFTPVRRSHLAVIRRLDPIASNVLAASFSPDGRTIALIRSSAASDLDSRLAAVIGHRRQSGSARHCCGASTRRRWYVSLQSSTRRETLMLNSCLSRTIGISGIHRPGRQMEGKILFLASDGRKTYPSHTGLRQQSRCTRSRSSLIHLFLVHQRLSTVGRWRTDSLGSEVLDGKINSGDRFPERPPGHRAHRCRGATGLLDRCHLVIRPGGPQTLSTAGRWLSQP